MDKTIENEDSNIESITREGQKWIDDEGFLRDEGILFGYSNTSPDEKLEAINRYYKSIIDPIKWKIDHYKEEELKINKKIAVLVEPIIQLPIQQIDKLSNYFLRNIVGLLLTGGACFFNYFLIAHDLRSSEPKSQFIAVGVYLFGIFMTFTSKNLLFHNTDDNIPNSKSVFYLYLLEFGVPLVAATFVAYKVFSTQGLATAIVHFLFILLLFIIPGKLFLSMLKQITDDIKRISQNMINKKANTSITKTYYDKEEVERQQLVTLEEALKLEITKRYNHEQEIARLEEEKESKKNLFMSEYNLARTFSQKFTAHQEFNYLTELKSS